MFPISISHMRAFRSRMGKQRTCNYGKARSKTENSYLDPRGLIDCDKHYFSKMPYRCFLSVLGVS